MHEITSKIKKLNEANDDWLKAIKYKLMAENAFRFFRGASSLFFEDLHKQPLPFTSPIAWVCGDLHIENFGSYRGDTGVIYFDMNDFDDAFLAPLSYDLVRFISSIFLAFNSLKIKEEESVKSAQIFLKSFCNTLAEGSARYVEPQTATGIVRKFLKSAEDKTEKRLLGEKTYIRNGKLKLDKELKKHLKIEKNLKKKLIANFESWIRLTNEPPNDYKVLDACFRIAGAGSIGIERYLFLIQKVKDPSKLMLIEQKEARASTLKSFVSISQPFFASEAERIVAVQKRMQHIPPAHLSTVNFNGKSFVMQEMQPAKDRFDFKLIENNFKNIRKVMEDMGIIAASSYLSSSGRQGSCIADELIDFGRRNEWQKMIIDYSHSYLAKAKKDYGLFREDYKTLIVKSVKELNDKQAELDQSELVIE